MQQKDIEQTQGGRADAHRLKRVQVQQTHLHVLHTPFTQGMQWPLAGVDHPLGADGAVELVLDLQQAGGELLVLTLSVLNADGLIRRPGPRQRILQ